MFINKLRILAPMAVVMVMFFAGQNACAQKLAVVEVDRIVEQLDERSVMEVELKNKAAELQAKENNKLRELEVINKNIDEGVYRVGTPAHKELLLSAELLTIEIQVMQAYHRKVMQRESVLLMQDLYRRLEETITQMGKEKGLDLIIFADAMPENRPQSQQEMMSFVFMRKVLYYNEKLNLTNEVISRMNTIFHAGRSGG